MRSKSMAMAGLKALCHHSRCFQRTAAEACKVKAPSPLLRSFPYRWIHRRDLVDVRQSAQVRPWVFSGELLREKLFKNLKRNDEGGNVKIMEERNNLIKTDEGKSLKKNDDRLRLHHVNPPELQKIAVEDLRKLVRLDRLEACKRKIEQIPHEIISHRDFLRFCMASAEKSSEDEAAALVKILDESGHIIVLGQNVHLRPHKVARALEMVMEMAVSPEADWRSLELANLEDQKKKIDEEAEKRAKAELWGGLGFFAFETALLMRWTFWELSWDVMEPVCFFLTSAYFIAGYVFFLRTSTAPTFEGIFKFRFEARQRQIMKDRKFDLERFKQLNTFFKPKSSIAYAN